VAEQVQRPPLLLPPQAFAEDHSLSLIAKKENEDFLLYKLGIDM
jgi:hypothetical protein